MRAVRFHGPGSGLRIVDLPLPEPTGTQVRVRVAGCGVCHTDLHVVDGVQTRVVPPVTLGHEVAGWIEALGPDATDAAPIGTPVVVFGGWGCGDCRECRAGAEQRCPESAAPGFQADGGYAPAMLVPHPRHLVTLSTLDPAHAAPLADAGITPYRAVTRAASPGCRRTRASSSSAAGRWDSSRSSISVCCRPTVQSWSITVRERDASRLERATELGADSRPAGGSR